MEKSLATLATSASKKLFQQIRRLFSDPLLMQLDERMMLVWRESYIRGAFAAQQRSTPMIVRSFNDNFEGRVDILGHSMNMDALVSCNAMEDGNMQKIPFGYVFTGSQRCVIATNGELGVEDMNGVKAIKMPYSMLAAHLDRGGMPAVEEFM
jgi:hypothetical protein